MAAPKFQVWTSTVALKFLMALTGVALVGFVVQHMFAHMQVFLGADAYNGYAHFMYGLGGLLWIMRGGILLMFVVHIYCAKTLRTRNLEARPQAYVAKVDQTTTSYAKTMIITGSALLAFVGYHLAHFTIGVAHPEKFSVMDAEGRRDVFGNFVYSFQNPLIFVLYVGAMVAISMHLAHAATSMFRTLGIMQGRFRAPLSKVGPALGVVCGLGFLIPPLACLLRIVTV